MTFVFPRPLHLSALREKAQRDAQAHGVSYSGDARRGAASYRGFAGNYEIDDAYLTITVTKKPPFVPRGRIERAIKEYVAEPQKKP